MSADKHARGATPAAATVALWLVAIVVTAALAGIPAVLLSLCAGAVAAVALDRIAP